MASLDNNLILMIYLRQNELKHWEILNCFVVNMEDQDIFIKSICYPSASLKG